VATASQSGDRYEQARALGGLARSYHVAGDPGQADDHWRRAQACYAELGLPEAELGLPEADHVRAQAG